MNVWVCDGGNSTRISVAQMLGRKLLVACLTGAAVLVFSVFLAEEAKAQSGSPTSVTQFLDPRYPLSPAVAPQTIYINPNNNYVTVRVRLVQLYNSYWDPDAKVAVYNRPVVINIPGYVANRTVYTDSQGVAALYVNNLSLGVQQFNCYVSYSGAGGNYNGVPLNPTSASFAIIRQSPF